MKKTIIAVGMLFAMTMSATIHAQESGKKENEEGFVFTTVKENPITSIKNQNRAGTCWCYSTMAFLESELLRMGKGEYDLSEMFTVYNTYLDRADAAVRTHGDVSFSQGGSFYDVIYGMEAFGLVPEEEMRPGVMYGDTLSNHTELSALADAMVAAVAKGKLRNTQFPIEVQDNWRHGLSYNLPIDELMEVFDNAINTGYTIAWGSDVSESGFTRDGVAVMPDNDKVQELSGSDMAHWLKLKPEEKKLNTKPQPQKWCTQEERQLAYDNYETTDDHGMQIYGIAKDQEGNEYYMVKNSWGTSNKYEGIWYASKAFVRYKTMNIVVHKDALPKAIKAKLGIK